MVKQDLVPGIIAHYLTENINRFRINRKGISGRNRHANGSV